MSLPLCDGVSSTAAHWSIDTYLVSYAAHNSMLQTCGRASTLNSAAAAMLTETCNCMPALFCAKASCVVLQAAASTGSSCDGPKAQTCCISSCGVLHAAGTCHGSCCRQSAQQQLGSNSTAAEGCASSSTDICSLAGRHSLLSKVADWKSLSNAMQFLLCLGICMCLYL